MRALAPRRGGIRVRLLDLLSAASAPMLSGLALGDLLPGPGALAGALAPEQEARLRDVVSGGALLLLAYAGWAHASGRATLGQVRGLVAAAAGFLLAAIGAAALRDHGAASGVVSVGGSLLAAWGMLTLMRERRQLRELDAARDAERARAAAARERGRPAG
jgi:hypothetical protein